MHLESRYHVTYYFRSIHSNTFLGEIINYGSRGPKESVGGGGVSNGGCHKIKFYKESKFDQNF